MQLQFSFRMIRKISRLSPLSDISENLLHLERAPCIRLEKFRCIFLFINSITTTWHVFFNTSSSALCRLHSGHALPWPCKAFFFICSQVLTVFHPFSSLPFHTFVKNNFSSVLSNFSMHSVWKLHQSGRLIQLRRCCPSSPGLYRFVYWF